MKEKSDIAYFLTTFFRDFLISERNLSPNTVSSYRDTLKLFMLFLKGETGKDCTKLQMRDIDGNLVRRFLTFLEEKRRNSIRSRNQRLAALRTFFEYVAGKEPEYAGICASVTSISSKKGPRANIDYLEKEEMEGIFEEVRRGSKESLRDYALFLFLFNAGARVQEAADLRITWLTLSKPYRVSILGKGRKWRVCPLWAVTGETLRNFIAERKNPPDDEHVFLNRFGNQISRHGIFDIVKKYVKIAADKIPRLTKKRISPHTIRHTTAMSLLQSGVELNVIRDWLGHASLETTYQYAQIDLEMKTRAMERCEKLVPENQDESRKPPKWKTNPDILAWLDSL